MYKLLNCPLKRKRIKFLVMLEALEIVEVCAPQIVEVLIGV